MSFHPGKLIEGKREREREREIEREKGRKKESERELYALQRRRHVPIAVKA